MEFTEPLWAEQHLNRDGNTYETLCGWLFEDLEKGVAVYDHRDGFDDRKNNACQDCADKADAIQNGAR